MQMKMEYDEYRFTMVILMCINVSTYSIYNRLNIVLSRCMPFVYVSDCIEYPHCTFAFNICVAVAKHYGIFIGVLQLITEFVETTNISSVYLPSFWWNIYVQTCKLTRSVPRHLDIFSHISFPNKYMKILIIYAVEFDVIFISHIHDLIFTQNFHVLNTSRYKCDY
ncbi:hypothetical protein H8356DRAFT_1417893 [Neocallimastix lanati (nom. inval.)]|nr:hypothetical protein H8356DRAFT_1417893 [Neocallimastix sp. JGI-2020a]